MAYSKVTATHVHADRQIVRSFNCTNIDRSDVSVEERLVFDSSGFHLGYHPIVTEIAEGGVVNLDMS